MSPEKFKNITLKIKPFLAFYSKTSFRLMLARIFTKLYNCIYEVKILLIITIYGGF